METLSKENGGEPRELMKLNFKLESLEMKMKTQMKKKDKEIESLQFRIDQLYQEVSALQSQIFILQEENRKILTNLADHQEEDRKILTNLADHQEEDRKIANLSEQVEFLLKSRERSNRLYRRRFTKLVRIKICKLMEWDYKSMEGKNWNTCIQEMKDSEIERLGNFGIGNEHLRLIESGDPIYKNGNAVADDDMEPRLAEIILEMKDNSLKATFESLFRFLFEKDVNDYWSDEE